MIRISTIFIAICMVLVAASLGLILYSVAHLSGTESAIVALAALTFMILYNAVSMRLRDRSDVGSQIADLSRGTADLARQVAEFADLADDALDTIGAGGVGGDHATFDRRKPAAELRDLTGEVGGAAGEVGDLAADIGAVAQPHRHGIVEDEEGQRGQRHQR